MVRGAGGVLLMSYRVRNDGKLKRLVRIPHELKDEESDELIVRLQEMCDDAQRLREEEVRLREEETRLREEAEQEVARLREEIERLKR